MQEILGTSWDSGECSGGDRIGTWFLYSLDDLTYFQKLLGAHKHCWAENSWKKKLRLLITRLLNVVYVFHVLAQKLRLYSHKSLKLLLVPRQALSLRKRLLVGSTVLWVQTLCKSINPHSCWIKGDATWITFTRPVKRWCRVTAVNQGMGHASAQSKSRYATWLPATVTRQQCTISDSYRRVISTL